MAWQVFKKSISALQQQCNVSQVSAVSLSGSKLLSYLFSIKGNSVHKRATILLHICQAMIAIICAQSLKLIGAPDLSYELIFDDYYISNARLNINLVYLHFVNMIIHVLLFSLVLFYLKKSNVKRAKYLLLIAFTTYIFVACLLWRYNLNLQYYFLLSMFVSCYIFDKNENRTLIIAISAQIILFIGLHHYLPSLDQISSLMYSGETFGYLHNISKINTFVFAGSCVICALFVRRILAKNWRLLSQYEASQASLLKKLFPAQLMPSLLHAQTTQQLNKVNSDMQTTQQMGVVFLDICQFTQLSTNKTNNDFSWQAIYRLFANYDFAINDLDAKRIKTNGDQYILLVGLHAEKRSHCVNALQTITACQRLLSVSNMNVKIGAAFGTVTCGIFDPNNPNFDIWGETVIRAARLEALAQANCILVDTHLYALTKHQLNYAEPSVKCLKGLGEQQVYEAPSSSLDKFNKP